VQNRSRRDAVCNSVQDDSPLLGDALGVLQAAEDPVQGVVEGERLGTEDGQGKAVGGHTEEGIGVLRSRQVVGDKQIAEGGGRKAGGGGGQERGGSVREADSEEGREGGSEGGGK